MASPELIKQWKATATLLQRLSTRINSPYSGSNTPWRRVVDRFLVPATAEPHISCTIVGSAEFLERDPGGKWLTRHIRRGDIFVTRSRTPYEISFRSPAGEELETIAIHVGIDSFRTALEAIKSRQR
jgi:hypothetical protein